MNTLLITADPEIGRYAEESGVAAIFVDMETRGKGERQGHLDTHMARHSLQDVAALASVLKRAELMVRVNPPWEETEKEARQAIAAGATRLMLPMFRTRQQVAKFKAAAGITPVTLLVETAAAITRLPGILPLLDSADRIHFGLNDLAIDMKLGFLFEVMSGRLLDGPAALCREAGFAFGVGGVSRVGLGDLPAEWILGEHVRIGSEWVILSRDFHGCAATITELRKKLDLAKELDSIKRVVEDWRMQSESARLANHARLAVKVSEIVGERT